MVLDPNDFQDDEALTDDTLIASDDSDVDEEDEDEDGLEDELESDEEDDSIEEAI